MTLDNFLAAVLGFVVSGAAVIAFEMWYKKRRAAKSKAEPTHKLLDTSVLQLESLKSFMKSCGYYMVTTDCNVFFRTDGDSYTAKSKRVVSFQTAVAWHNDAFASPTHKLFEEVKLQRSGANVVVQSHKVKPLPHYLGVVNASNLTVIGEWKTD